MYMRRFESKRWSEDQGKGFVLSLLKLSTIKYYFTTHDIHVYIGNVYQKLY